MKIYYRKRRKLIILINLIILLIILLLSIKLIQKRRTTTNLEKIYSSPTKNIIIVDKTTEDEKNDIIENVTEENNTESNNTEQNNTEESNNENNKQEQIPNETNNKGNREFGSNVAFIGDSRTQAFLMYSGLKDVIDYTNIGLMVDTAVTKKFVTNKKGEKITILEDMRNKNIDTVYIMLGINELGWVYNSIFIQKYEELIDKIKAIKPECEIILESIIPVTKTRSDKDNIYNNDKIVEYNKLIKQMANRKGIQYIDLVPILADQNGNLPENATPDGIHLNKEYCLKWLNCLKNN